MQRWTKNKKRQRKSLRKIKQANIQSKDIIEDIETTQLNHQRQKRLIYGTNIDIDHAKNDLKFFICNFQKPPVDCTSPPQKPYRNMLISFQDIQDPQVVLEVSGKDIFQFNKEMYYQFIYYPCEMFQIFDQALKQSFLQFFASQQNEKSINLKIKSKAQTLLTSIINLRNQQIVKIHCLSPKFINKLISVNALVTRVSQIIPELHEACFQCEFCYNYQKIKIQNAKVSNPSFCKECNRRNTMFINHNLSKFIDKQYIKLQQLPQQLEEGTTPIMIGAFAFHDNVDKVKSGDCVQIIGIYRATPILIVGSRNQNKSVFRTYIDVISIRINAQFSKILSKNTSFSDEQKRRFFKYADSPQIVEKLIKSFAPSIVQSDLVKLGLLAQIFGGTPNQSFLNRPHIRSDINVCMIGDPSTAKSQLLKQVHKISTRGVMVCGSGSSSQGLTVTVRKDPQTSQFIIQGGALVMSDGGICCIDQFDKIGVNSQIALLQAMQQQTISVAKAGIVCQLKARTSLLVAANPIKSKYDVNKSVIENINLPPALISRFDLIYILLDLPDKVQDLKIANHILSLYSSPNRYMDKTIMPHDQLLKYISFARNYVHPSISQQVGKIIGNEYSLMRGLKLTSNKVIRSTPRQLQSIIRLSQAFAKMRLSQKVEKIDVQSAAKVIREATLKAATDPLTGKIDINILTTGKSQAKRDEEDKIGKVVKQFLTANTSTYRKPTYIHKLHDKFKQRAKMQIQKEDFIYVLRKIEADDMIVIFGGDPKNLQFKLHKNFE